MAGPTVSPMSLIDPQSVADQQAIEQQRQLAQALMAQGLHPDLSTQMVGNVAIRRSPLEGLASVLRVYSGRQMLNDANQKAVAMNQRYAAMLSNALGNGDSPYSPPSQGGAQNPYSAPPQAEQSGGQGMPQQAQQPDAGQPAPATAFGGQPQPQYQQPQQQFTQPRQQGPYSLQNIIRGSAVQALGGDAAASAYWKQYEATPLVQNMRAAGIDPSSVLGQQIIQNNLAKENYIAPVSGRPGGVMIYADGRQEQMPSEIKGSQAVRNPDGTWSYRPMQGASSAMKNAEAAQSIGSSYGKVQMAYDQNGRPVYANSGVLADQTSGGAPGGMGGFTGRYPQQPGQGSTGGLSPALAPGQLQRAEANASAQVGLGKDQYNSALSEAANLGQYRQALNEMWNLANSSAKFGPGAPDVARMKALASNIPGLNLSDAQTSQDVMRKMANFIAMSQLGGGGQTGTNAQLDTILHQLPNGEMTNEAMKQVIPTLVSQLDVKQARANVARNLLNANNQDLSGLPTQLSKFNQVADPGTVSIGMQMSRLKGKALTDYTNGLIAKYGPQQYNQIKQNLMMLDRMGAFQ